MPSKLDTLVMEERLSEVKSRAPAQLVTCGQRWIDDTAHCYKCHHFKSNRHNSGACALAIIGGSILSQDFARGDYCRTDYSPKWTPEVGLTPAPAAKI